MKKQQGLTLIEILISLALGLFIIAATLTLYVNTIISSSSTLKSTRLNHDLSISISLMSNDIKRAGYWGQAKVDSNGFDNPFNVEAVAPAISTNLQVHTLNSAGDCILYSYDADMDGIVDANEFYGFRLRNSNIEMRLTGTTTSDCTDGSWQAIGENNILEVTAIKFSLVSLDSATDTSPCTDLTDATCLSGVTRCLNYDTSAVTSTGTCSFTPVSPATSVKVAEKREVNITLTGRLKDDTVVTKSLTGTVVVRNDRLLRQS